MNHRNMSFEVPIYLQQMHKSLIISNQRISFIVIKCRIQYYGATRKFTASHKQVGFQLTSCKTVFARYFPPCTELTPVAKRKSHGICYSQSTDNRSVCY